VKTIITVDTETTGLDVQRDRVVELAYSLDGVEAVVHRFNPGMLMEPEVIAKHGITNEELASCPPFSAWWQDMVGDLEGAGVWVGYNPQFDIEILMAEFARCGHVFRPPRMVVDPKRLWDINDPRPPRTLEAAYKTFVDPAGFANAHSAKADILATRRVLDAMLDKWQLRGKPWSELDPERATWWGPTKHIAWQPWTIGRRGIGNADPMYSLVANFGKYEGRCVVEQVPRDYWRWLLSQDFPSHVKQLASALLDDTKHPTAVLQWAWKQWPPMKGVV